MKSFKTKPDFCNVLKNLSVDQFTVDDLTKAYLNSPDTIHQSKKAARQFVYRNMQRMMETGDLVRLPVTHGWPQYTLTEQFHSKKLEEYKERVCKGIDYDETYCNLARTAVNDVKEDKIVFYQQNREALVADFNECQSIYQDLVDKKMKKEAKLAVDSYKCQLALAGARKLKVYSFSKPL